MINNIIIFIKYIHYFSTKFFKEIYRCLLEFCYLELLVLIKYKQTFLYLKISKT